MINPKDPLLRTEDKARALFEQFSKLCNGVDNQVIIEAACNIFINAVRQKHSRRQSAMDDFEQMMTKLRAIIANHYSPSGKRLNIFPHHQTVEVPHFDFRVKLDG